MQPSKPLGYVPQLDAVRGIACLMVLVAHLRAVSGLGWIDDLVGTAGVGLFFALSGFLITRILLADRAAGRGLNAFYNRRAARIFPAYFLMLGIVWCLAPGREIAWAATFTFNLHYTTGCREYFQIDAGGGDPIPPVAHVWSLCVEEHFYWVWPALVMFLPALCYRLLPLVCIAATPFITAFLVTQLEARGFQELAAAGMAWRLTPTQLVALSCGALLALHEGRLRQRLLLVLGVLALVASVVLWWGLPVWWPRLRGIVYQPALLHLGCAGALALGLGWPGLARLGWLGFVGKLSYGLYLYHLPLYAALGLAQTKVVAPWSTGLAAFSLTFLAALASYYLVEAPILNWMRGHQGGLRVTLPWKSLSLGTALTALLVVALSWQSVAWARKHPIVEGKLTATLILGPDGRQIGYTYLGVDHYINQERFRGRTPLPARTAGQPRVAVVGDSYIFGQCVPEERVATAIAERWLRQRGTVVEVLNLGRPGMQAEDAVWLVRDRVVPHLHADIVVYAATTSDFLPAGAPRNGNSDRAFHTDPSYAARFRGAVCGLRALCAQAGLELRVLPFLHSLDLPDSVAAIRLVQRLCREEGVPLIDIDPYLEAHHGTHFRVHPRDSHPNAECHRLHGEMLAAELQRILAARRRP